MSQYAHEHPEQFEPGGSGFGPLLDAADRARDEAEYTAFRVHAHGLLMRDAIVCATCASHYDDGLISTATWGEVSDALDRISEDLIGRIGPVSEREAACYDCEEEL